MNKNIYERKLFDEIILSLKKHGALPEIISIIVTGSFGRHEETFSVIDNKEILISDVEIALVYKNIRNKRKLQKLLPLIAKDFQEELNLMPISQRRIIKKLNFNGGLISRKKKTIFMFDLYKGSYTIFGNDLIKNRFIEISELDKFEAKRIVSNRIGELIYSCRNSNLSIQWKAKLLLAIGSAWLIIYNKYDSSYFQQHKLLLLNNEKLNEVFGLKFVTDYNNAFNFLRKNGEEFDIDLSRLRNYVNLINGIFQKNKIVKPKINSFSRYWKYVMKYLRYKYLSYNIFNFEEKILQELITNFIIYDKNKLDLTASIWHKILY